MIPRYRMRLRHDPHAVELADPMRLWLSLAAAQQMNIGAAALALEISLAGIDWTGDDLARMRQARRFDVSQTEAHATLAMTFRAALPGLAAAPPFVDLNKLGTRMCRRCGCTDYAACPPDEKGRGCSWIGPELCSRCAPPRVLERAAEGEPGEGEAS
jgi:hypothetical protein